jgi:hypothetical protein
MHIVKRFAGATLTVLAIGLFVNGLGSSGNGSASQSILDSPEASGRMLGTIIPVVLLGVIGVRLLFSKKQAI